MRRARSSPPTAIRGAVAAVSCAALLAAAGTPGVSVSKLSARVYLASVRDAGNSGFVAGSSRGLVVDPPPDDARARELLREVRRVAGQAPLWIVRTRAGGRSPGEAVFRKAGGSPAPARGVLDLGGTAAEISVVRVHPAGDTIVSIAPDGIVFAGGLVGKDAVPDLAGADTRAWTVLLDDFLDRHPAAVFVGSRGEPAHALDVRYLRDYVGGLRLAVEQGLSRGESESSLVDRLLAVQRARFGHWKDFETRGRGNIEAVVREVSGTAAAPPR
jgi:hypothetical protein